MENHDPASEEIVGIFEDGDKLTAHGKIAAWLETQRFRLYLGWDGEVYPKFYLKKEYLR